MRLASTFLLGVGVVLIASQEVVLAQEADTDTAPAKAKSAATQADPFAKQAVPLQGEFRDGWEQTVELPATSGTIAGDAVRLWVADGLLKARRESAAGETDWQLILCRAEEANEPQIYVKQGTPYFEVRCNDGRYFIREIGMHLHVLREPGIDEGLFDIEGIRGEEAKRRGMSGNDAITVEGWDEANWFTVAIGPTDRGWNAVVRLNPVDFTKRGFGFGGGSLPAAWHGEASITDDGELLVVKRTLPAVYLAEKKREAARQAILAGKLPPIDSAKWLNTDDTFDWETLKGKVVLVDFWGTWCGPCVAKLPELQPLHEKYADRGLAIIAIHSANSSDACEEFIREHGFTFPVAIDSGKTAEEFAVSAWPTYFLIDRAGKVVEGFNHATPTEETIAKLIATSE